MILYKLNNSNYISWWSIEQDVDEHQHARCGYSISWGQRGGNSDNTNYYITDTPEKAAAEVQSLIKQQIERRGYTVEIPTTVPDLPMLAQSWKDHTEKSRKPFPSAFLQPKLDGVRCLATRQRITSRRAEKITTCPHIEYLLESLPEGYKLDGELYIPRVDLQTIQSYVLRNRPHQLYKQIEYHVFDLVDTEKSFKERYEELQSIVSTLQAAHAELWSIYTSIPEKLRSKTPLSETCPIKLVPSTYIADSTHEKSFYEILKGYHTDCVTQNYEGVMVRNPEAPYELNYRSPNLLKFKERMDAEFKCIDISAGYNQTGIFVCKTAEGNIFEATPSWTTDKKRWLLRNKELHIGRWVTVEFERYSKDGTPLKPVAKCTRIDHDDNAGTNQSEPEVDDSNSV